MEKKRETKELYVLVGTPTLREINKDFNKDRHFLVIWEQDSMYV